MEKVEYILNSISGAISSLTVIVAFLLAISKKSREFLKNVINKNAGTDSQNKTIEEISDSVKDMKEQLAVLEKSQVVMLRENIIRYYDICMPKKHITRYGIRIVNEMYDQYHNGLGQNSYITDLVEALRQLPVTNTEVDLENEE